MKIRKACTIGALSVLGAIASVSATAACNDATAARVRSSNLDDQGKLNMLRGLGCDASDLAKKIEDDHQAAIELNRKVNEQRAERERVAREEKAKKAEAEMAKAIAEDNVRRDAFEQEMADKCGEYPLDLKIGMSEKLLAMGCVSPVEMVGADRRARIYRIYGAQVSVLNGKVVRWIRQ